MRLLFLLSCLHLNPSSTSLLVISSLRSCSTQSFCFLLRIPPWTLHHHLPVHFNVILRSCILNQSQAIHRLLIRPHERLFTLLRINAWITNRKISTRYDKTHNPRLAFYIQLYLILLEMQWFATLTSAFQPDNDFGFDHPLKLWCFSLQFN